MHDDIIVSNNIVKPKGEVFIVYFSSSTGNTDRFVKKLSFKSARIPWDKTEKMITVKNDYVIICPTYSGGGEFTKDAVPKQVIKFLNIENNRKHCRGVVPTGNTNFNNTYCLAGIRISKKLKVPMLYQLELSGTQSDVQKAQVILKNFWKPNK